MEQTAVIEDRNGSYCHDAGPVSLACAIIQQAVEDWNALTSGNPIPAELKKDAYWFNKHELQKFFYSDWFELLCSYSIGDDKIEKARKALGVEKPIVRKKNVRKQR